jgi:undecaprenyl-diphosphatase
VNIVRLRRGRAVLEWVKAEIAPLAALLGAATFGLGFGLLAQDVFEGSTAGLDRDLLLALRSSADLSDPLGPPWLEEAAGDLTSLGSLSVLGLIVLASALCLLFGGNGRAALLVLAAVAGGVLLVTALKIGFARPRPDIVPPLARVFSTSFPSSHAALSAAVYLTLGALFARIAAARPMKVYLVTLAVFLTVVVGVSRVYLGLHYPTDVLGGWCVGAAWAMLCWAIALYLQSRGRLGSIGRLV